MHKCCTLNQMRQNQRRVHGLQLPLNCYQIVCWIVFILTACVNFAILIPIQFEELKFVSVAVYILLYVTHIIAHVAALLLDPSENDLRKREIYVLPEFDRALHAHVIENGRCHLCNINTSDKKTKHCGICNKCVFQFDHHCMWLNNCVGRRNYSAFIVCVVSALLLTLFTTSLCITDIVYFFTNPHQLSKIAQSFINCSSIMEGILAVIYCKNSVLFIIFLIFYGVCGVGIGCALLHLICFHVYISFLGVSTYEYIVQTTNRKSPYEINWCRNKMSNTYLVNLNKDVKTKETKVNKNTNTTQDNSVSHLINVVINNEFLKAKRIILQDSNKIHPSSEVGIS